MEERSKGSGMPSLLTPAQQAEADRNRILTKLEHGKAHPRSAGGRAGRILAWGAAGVMALVLAGGAMFWTAGGKSAVPQVAAARPDATVAVPERAAPEVATIRDEPAPLVLVPEAPAKEVRASTAVASEAAGKAPAHKATVIASAKPPPKTAPSVPRKASPRVELDKDIALLSALVAHTHVARAVKNDLDACNLQKGSKARACRREACEGSEDIVAACRQPVR